MVIRGFFASGNGNCVTHQASDGGHYDLGEGSNLLFEICLYNGGYNFCDYAIWYNG